MSTVLDDCQIIAGDNAEQVATTPVGSGQELPRTWRRCRNGYFRVMSLSLWNEITPNVEMPAHPALTSLVDAGSMQQAPEFDTNDTAVLRRPEISDARVKGLMK